MRLYTCNAFVTPKVVIYYTSIHVGRLSADSCSLHDGARINLARGVLEAVEHLFGDSRAVLRVTSQLISRKLWRAITFWNSSTISCILAIHASFI